MDEIDFSKLIIRYPTQLVLSVEFNDSPAISFDTPIFHHDMDRLSNWNTSNDMIANQSKTKCSPLADKPVVYLNQRAFAKHANSKRPRYSQS